MTALPDYTSEYDSVLADDDHRERFRIHDDQAATWAMRKLRSIQAKQDENRKIAEAEILQIQQWLEEVTRPLDRDVQYFTGLLIDYARRQRLDEGRKTISLPFGKVASRPASDKWIINADEFLPWAREHRPDLIRVKEEPALSLVKDAFAGAPIAATNGHAVTEEGEIVPGVLVTPGDLSFTVTTD